MSQNDMTIDNSTGANVRADINSAIQALATNNSGSSAPSTTFALQSFANTTDSMLQLRNAANNAFVNLRKFDGTLPLPDGSVSSPSLFFDDDTNTGIFSSAADTFNVATGGVERMELGTTTIFNEDGADVDFRIEGDTNANLFYVNAGTNRIGIGDPNPDSLLHIGNGTNADDGAVTITIGGSSVNARQSSIVKNNVGGSDRALEFHATTASGNHETMKFFSDASQERMRIDSSGRVMIGTTTEGHANGDDLTIATSGNTGLTIRSGTSSAGNIYFSDGTSGDDEYRGFISYDHSNNLFNFATNSATKMTIDSSGNIAVQGGIIQFKQQGNSINTQNGQIGGGNSSQANNARIAFNTDSAVNNGNMTFHTMSGGTDSERMRIDSSGNVVVGATSANGSDACTLNSSGEFRGAGYYFTNNIGSPMSSDGIRRATTGTIVFDTGSAERLRIDSSGKVLVGTTSGSNFSSNVAEFVNATADAAVGVRSTTGVENQDFILFKFGGGPSACGGVRRDGTTQGPEFFSNSDRRIKTNILDMDNTLDKINQLSLKKFDLKDGSGSGIGLIAQDLISIFPNKVKKDASDDGTGDTVPNGVTPWTVGHNFTFELLKAIQELTARVEALEAA